MAGQKQTELEVIVGKIEQRTVEIAQLEETIAVERAKEERAIMASCAIPGDQPYFKGRPAHTAREAARKASERKAELEVELVALAARKGELEANESVRRLDEAREKLPAAHDALDAAYTAAADRFAEFVRVWPVLVAAWREYGDLRGSVENGGPLDEVARVDPAAAQRWRDSAVTAYRPAPAHFGQLVAQFVSVALDPDDGTKSGAPTPAALRALVPHDLERLNMRARLPAGVMPAVASSWSLERFGEAMALRVERQHAAANPPPKPEPTAEEIAVEAARVAEVERQFEARKRREQAQARSRGHAVSAPPPVGDLSAEDAAFVEEARRDLAGAGLL